LPGGEEENGEPRQREVPRSKKWQLYALDQGFSTVENVSQSHEVTGVVWRYFCLSPLIRSYSWKDQKCYSKSQKAQNSTYRMSDGALSLNSLEVGVSCPKTWENMEGL
jgi:hypothetical protein